METMSFTVSIQTMVTRGSIESLLCSAFEGGSNYWYRDLHISRMPDGKESKKDFKHWHLEVPLLPGGELGFRDMEDPDDDSADADGLYRLDQLKIQKGLETMANKYPRHWQDFINESHDAWTGDCFLQCCIFGEALYG